MKKLTPGPDKKSDVFKIVCPKFEIFLKNKDIFSRLSYLGN